MTINRKIAKELRFIFLYIIMCIGILLIPGYGDESKKVVLAFIFGIPILFSIIGYFRRLYKLPVICEINENEIILGYFSRQGLSIPIQNIIEIDIKIHSQKTAIINIILYDCESKIFNVGIYRNSWDNFIEFSEYLSSIFNESGKLKVYKMEDKLGKECSQFSESLNWYEYLTQKRTKKDVLNEITKEGIIKKVLITVCCSLIIFIKSINSTYDVNITIGTIVVGLILYLIISFYLRMAGYSRKESIKIFGAIFFYLMLGIGAVYGIVMWILSFKII